MKVTGVLEVKGGGYGFVRCENRDVYISSSMMNGAVHGQTVEAETELFTWEEDGGRITRILSPYPEMVGDVYRAYRKIYVRPDNWRYPCISIPDGKTMDACPGDKVVVSVSGTVGESSLLEGSITEILGKKKDPGIDIIAVARSYGFKEDFPKATEKHARGLRFLPDTVKRTDFRSSTVFTIDNDDAMDLDDAVSVEKNEAGNFILGVHIADVSHYVREDDPIDQEALKRGTSVYFPGMVIPMLPKVLSDDLCSLNTDGDKLTLSCIMEIDSDGNILSSELKKSIIRSCGRLTYSGVNSFLKGKDKCNYAYLGKELGLLSELSRILKSRREKSGSIDFNIKEAEIILDEAGNPCSIRAARRGEAEKIIEECMLAANMTVAETYRMMEIPFIYRVHEQPDGTDVHKLAAFLSGLGYSLKGNQNIHPKAIQTVLKQAEGKKSEAVINRVVLRMLKKARYDTLPKGHFGLAMDNYCHFTSPIRRYPDLMVHRIISTFLEGQLDDEAAEHFDNILSPVAFRSSECERKAVEAERTVRDMKMAQYMSKHIGGIYSAVVSGVTGFGVFVELKNTIEGLIHISELFDDYYELDSENYQLVGVYTGRTIRVGDHIQVKCFAVGRQSCTIDFVPV